MNNLGNINTTQQRPVSQATSTATASNNGVAQQQFLGQIAPQQHQPQFNANILQLLLTLIQQLIQLISDQKPDEPEPPQDQTLNPDEATRDKLANILGVSADTVKVTDRDGDGQLSAGDLVEGTVNNALVQNEAVSYELSDLALKDANDELGSSLSLTPEASAALSSLDAVKNTFDSNNVPDVIEKVLDSDGSGRISAGDVVAVRSLGGTPSSLNYVELSAADVKQFEDTAYGPDLELPQDDLNRLDSIINPGAFGGTPPGIDRVFDANGDGQLSAGDIMEVRSMPFLSPPAPGVDLPEVKPTFSYVEVTQTILDELNQGIPEEPKEPELPPRDGGDVTSKLADILGVPADTITITDTDGDGQLSVGDVIDGRVESDFVEDGVVGTDPVRYVLNDLALKDINGELGSQLTLPDGIGGALLNVDAVKNDPSSTQLSSIDKVFDTDGSGRLSEGDVVAIRAGGVPPYSLSYIELSADDVKQFEDAAYGVDLEIPQSALDRFAVGTGNSASTAERVFDKNGDGQLSVGDLMEVKSTPAFLSPPAPGVDLPEVKSTFSYVEVTQTILDELNQGIPEEPKEPELPVSVSGGGVTVGSAIYSGGNDISNDRVVMIKGRHYSVGFLKQQVDDYANSPYATATSNSDGVQGAVADSKPWGGGGSSFRTSQFQSYISDTFPYGDPDVSNNPPVRYENNLLIVNNQAYASDLTDPQSVGAESVYIENTPENQDAVQQIIEMFPEVQIVRDFRGSDGNRNSGFAVDVPSDYYGQWQAALMDNLPAGSEVRVAVAIE